MMNLSGNRLLFAVFSVAALACQSPAADNSVSQLTVAPASLDLSADDSGKLTATAVLNSGTAVSETAILWSTSDTSIAWVGPRGRVHALRSGVATVTALAGGQSASAQVTATYPPLVGVRLYAHRGFATTFPENTLVAVDSALARGADGIESDVQLTSDSVAVIIHDATVDRTTNGTGNVGNLTASQIRSLDACSKKGAQWSPCQIPLADELIQKLHGRGLLILDLKGPWPDSQLRKLLAMVRQHGMTESTMVTSFLIGHLSRVRRIDPRITLGWLQGTPADPTLALNLGKAAIIPEEGGMRSDAAAMPAFAALLAARNSTLGAWTIYSPNAGITLRDLGVRWFISDIPLDKRTLTPP